MKKLIVLVGLVAASLAARGEKVAVPADVTRIDIDVTERHGRMTFRVDNRFKTSFDITVSAVSAWIKGREIKRGAVRFEPFGMDYQVVTDNEKLRYDTINGVYVSDGEGKRAVERPLGLVLSLRRVRRGVAAYVNGNYVGPFEFEGNLCEIDVPAAKCVSLFRDPVPDRDRFETVEYPAEITFPGAWSNATAKITAETDVPLPRVTGANADLGLRKSSFHRQGQRSFHRVTNYTALMVPAAEYVKAHVLCAVDPAAGLDRAFTVRLTTYTGDGRAFHGMMNRLVEFDQADKRIVGEVSAGGRTLPLWLVTVPVDTGDIADIVRTDMRGYWAHNLKRRDARYLDFEVLGRCNRDFHALGWAQKSRQVPDAEFTSAVHVFGATLEKPGAELLADPLVPGNIFHNDEKPMTEMRVFVRRPGTYRLGWKIYDAEDNLVGGGSQDFDMTTRIVADLAQPRLGWYRLDWTLSEGDGAPFLTHHASYALLGRDTRQEGAGSGPYTAWITGNHFSSEDPDVAFSIPMKQGIRRGVSEWHRKLFRPELYHPYKLAPMHVMSVQARGWLRERGPYHTTTNEAELVAQMRARMETDPAVRSMQLLWEDTADMSLQAPELIGLKPGPGHRSPTADTTPAERVAAVKEVADLVRRNFPDMRIVLGNTGSSSELVAEMIRGGVPESAADYVGIECMGRASLPERVGGANYLEVEYLAETAHNMGYGSWKPGASIECNSLAPDLIGKDNVAKWIVRHGLVGQLWRFPDINIGGGSLSGNYYTETLWGSAGDRDRAPYNYPHKGYVGVATLTKMLDQVTDARLLDTGDPCVYLGEFPRKDGKVAYALWTARGEAELELSATGDFAAVDFFGRPFEPKGSLANVLPGKSRYTVKADGWTRYFLAEPGVCLSAKVLGTAYPEDVEPKGFRAFATTDDFSKWRLVEEADPLLEATKRRHTPYRTKGAYVAKSVDDPERGRCIELSLAKPNLSLPKFFSEYGEIELREPVAIPGRPLTAGMWVKGNSGWGRVYFILRDAKGRRRISCGTRVHGGDCFDSSGRMSVNFTGWAFVSIGITTGSSVKPWSTGSHRNNWEYGRMDEHEENVGRGDPEVEDVAWPLQLVGVAFDAPSRPLDICARHARPQAVRFGPIGFYDFAPEEPTSLFDGRTLKGWHTEGGSAKFSVEDGTIAGVSIPGTPGNTFLCTDRAYGDFVLTGEFKCTSGNSGVQIRSATRPNATYAHGTEVYGCQYEITPYGGSLGRIYDEGGKPVPGQTWLDVATPQDRLDAAEKSFVKNGWNAFEIRCVGEEIKTWVNGVPVAEIRNADRMKGFLGLQIHAQRKLKPDGTPFEPCRAWWRNLRLTDLTRR